jgi:putative copper resistance protein D
MRLKTFHGPALLLASLDASVTSAYGWVLLAKVGTVAAMGAIAFSNKLWITPALKRGDDPALWLGRLQRQVTLKFALGVAVLALVGALGAMQPPVST